MTCPYKWMLYLLLTLDSSSFSMSSLDEENSLRVILDVLSPWPTEPIISCSFSWLPSVYILIQGIFLTKQKKGVKVQQNLQYRTQSAMLRHFMEAYISMIFISHVKFIFNLFSFGGFYLVCFVN